MLMIAADFWLHGNWPPNIAGSPTGGAELMKDVYGQTITVGSLVKLVGTVVALNPSDPHFQDVVITLNFPQAAPFPPSPTTQGVFVAAPVVAFHPLQLIVGS
jgi:hypothetical protein